MHRYATILCLCRKSSLDRRFYRIGTRLLSNIGADPSKLSNGQLKEGAHAWQNGQLLGRKRRAEDDRDIFVHDLSATLEAHRARNRASVIRKIEAPPSLFIRRPLLEVVEGSTTVERPCADNEEDSFADSSRAPNTLGLSEDESLTGKDDVKDTVTIRQEKGASVKAAQRSEAETARRWPADSVQAQKGTRRRSRRSYTSSTDILEYTGGYLYPDKPWKSVSQRPYDLQRPWLLYMEDSGINYTDRLSTEIKAFESYMKLTPTEEAASRIVTAEVTTILRNHVPNSSLTLIGSRNTGLAIPLSDLDFSVSAASSAEGKEWNYETSPRQTARAAERSLRVIEKHLRASASFSRPELVHARVPLVTSKHLPTGLDVQIQTLAPYQSAQEYTAAYLTELPSLRSLYIILRHSLEVRNLTTVYDGGLGSYTILMMIVTALKHSSGKFAADDLGGQLLHVLDFYANADLYKHGFSADPPRVFDKVNEARPLEEREARLLDPQLSGIDHILQRRNIRKPYLLTLQDPANDLSDLGKNAYAIKHVQATFKVACEGIRRAVQRQSLKSDDPNKGGTWSCLDFLIKADYKAFEIARSKIQHTIDQDGTGVNTSTEAIRRDMHDRANEFRGIKQNAQNGDNPIDKMRGLIKRQEVKAFKKPAVHIPSGNRAHKLAQAEALASRSIKLTVVGRFIRLSGARVSADIMDDWAPDPAEQQEENGWGKETFRVRKHKHAAGDGLIGDVEEGGKGF